MSKIRVITIDSELDSVNNLGFKTDLYAGSNFRNEVIVRWGNSYLEEDAKGCSLEFPHVINTSAAIQLNCAKNLALQKMSAVVNTPPVFIDTLPKGKLAVVRPWSHSSGYGFSVRKGPLQISRGYYATQFISTKTEYRVWFCGNQTICGIRVPFVRKGERAKPMPEFPCRSSWGYRFVKRVPRPLHAQTLLAAKAIGLEAGAADVLLSGHKYYFLELNSAPTVDARKIRVFYQSNLPRLAAKKFPALIDLDTELKKD